MSLTCRKESTNRVIGGRARQFSLDRTGDRLLFLGPSLVLSSVSTSTRLRHFDSFDYVEIESVIDVDEGNESKIEIDVDGNENDGNDEGSEIDVDENENDGNDEGSESDGNAIVGNDEGSESDGNAIVGIQNDNNEIWIKMGEIEVDESLSEILSDYEID
ncbi:hypothetical protein RCL_jg13888.t1 [Rhizophagus clarus]|uniref:Uncharacterized protein n=1 Tax=Rhizophagus clarus TaxID=94130 RepID=A0A8H3LRA0_9GLOM|nr:hypothetical protein RCL_jg13888.t1 [Rhizophagus clarus]